MGGLFRQFKVAYGSTATEFALFWGKAGVITMKVSWGAAGNFWGQWLSSASCEEVKTFSQIL